MKRSCIMFFVLMVIALNHLVMADLIDFNDGQTHILSDETYQLDTLRLDYDIANEYRTHVVLEESASVKRLWAYNKSTISISNGWVGHLILAYDDSEVTMTGGSVESGIAGYNNSTITLVGGSLLYGAEVMDDSIFNMSGGSIGVEIIAGNYSTVNISGGLISHAVGAFENNITTISGGTIGNMLVTGDNGTMYLVGSDFQVNGSPLSFGDKLSDFVPLIENGKYDYYTGTITGILNNGSALNTTFKIHNTGNYEGISDIIIVPEPATLSLLALGAFFAGRKRR